MIGQRLCQYLGGRTVFESDDRYSIHYHFVGAPTGTYFEISHVLVDDRDHSVTIGTPFDSSRWFRGHTTSAETTSLCPNGACCAADPSLSAKWSSNMYASVHEQPQILAVSPAGTFPGIDPVATFEFLESRTEG